MNEENRKQVEDFKEKRRKEIENNRKENRMKNIKIVIFGIVILIYSYLMFVYILDNLI